VKIIREQREQMLKRAEAERAIARSCSEEARLAPPQYAPIRAQEASIAERLAEILETEAKTLDEEAKSQERQADGARQRAATAM